MDVLSFSRVLERDTDHEEDSYEDSDVVQDSDTEIIKRGVKGEEDDDEEEQPLASRLPLVHPRKRKHSPTPSSTPSAQSPAPHQSHPTTHSSTAGHPSKSLHSDSTTVAPPPSLVPYSGSVLPESITDNYEFYSTRSYPINQLSYRYTVAGPVRPTKELPLPFYKTIETFPMEVRWSWEDRSSFSLLTKDCKSVTAEKGWRAVRANVPIREGSWYWEIKVERGGGEGGREKGGVGEGSWCRVGVGRRESPLNAPVGVDGHSYAYRDRSGEAVTLALPRPYGKPYTSTSTIGIYLSLPSRPSSPLSDLRDPRRIVRKRVPIRYKGQLFFESLEYAPSPEMEELAVDPATKAKVVVQETKAAPGTKARPAPADLRPPPREVPTLKGSKLAFFLDGECQGVAFEDLYDFLPLRMDENGFFRRKGLDPTYKRMENWHDDGFLGYFPFVSVFGGGIATINAGPDFEFPPPKDIEAVLKSSPRPPTSAPLEFEEKSAMGVEKELSEGNTWRPLCQRYVESMAEQAQLDEEDRLQAIKDFAAKTHKQQQESIRQNQLRINTSASATAAGHQSNSPSGTPASASTPVPTTTSFPISAAVAVNSPSSTSTSSVPSKSSKKLKLSTAVAGKAGSPSPRPSSPVPTNSSNLKKYSVTATAGAAGTTNLRYEETPGNSDDGEGEEEEKVKVEEVEVEVESGGGDAEVIDNTPDPELGDEVKMEL